MVLGGNCYVSQSEHGHVAVQALVALFMLNLMTIATLNWRPFQARHILRLEMLSLAILCTTMWLGSFFWALPESEVVSTIVSVMIIVINTAKY